MSSTDDTHRQNTAQHVNLKPGYKTVCGCIECYNPALEKLEYDYNYDDSTKPPQPYPRIRDRGEYYVDSYNDQPWSWTFGTHETVSAP